MKEKKLNAKQKLALERIYRLFELATIAKPKYQKRYLQLAKRIGEKVNVSVPKELQKTYCKKCFSMNVTQTKEDPFFILKCKNCSHVKKFRL
jgi:RNase P subunit RPR2